MYYNPIMNNQAGMSYGIPANPIGGFPIGYGGYNNGPVMINPMAGNTLQTSGLSNAINGYQVPLGQGMNPNQFTSFGGYYNNNYNAFNPYNLYKQQEAIVQQQKEEARKTVDILQRFKKISNSYDGKDTTSEELQYISDMYIPKEDPDNMTYEDYVKQQEKAKRLEIQNRLDSGNMIKGNVLAEQAKSRMYKVYSEYTERVPEDVGLVEYLEKYAQKDYMDSIEREAKKKEQDVRQLYNSDAFNKSIMNSRSMFGNALDPNVSIEDQEIHLPSFISDKTRQERRKAFVESLLGKGEL